MSSAIPLDGLTPRSGLWLSVLHGISAMSSAIPLDGLTPRQHEACKQLAERFGSNLEHADIMVAPFGLPDGWVSIVVYRAGSYSQVAIVGGVSPEGHVHT
jgi:hypothetical protein